MKKRVVWIIDSLGHGGAENLTLSLMQHFNRDRFILRVCALQIRNGNPIAKELEKIDIPVDLVQVPNLRHLANLPNLVRYLQKTKPDLIHTQLGFSDILGSFAAKLLGIPCVSTLHIVGLPENDFSEFLRVKLWWFCLRNFCDCVITVSEHTRNYHIQMGKLPKNKVVTIYNGIDLSIYEDKTQDKLRDIKRTLNINPNSVLIITVAVLRKQKGIQYMIEALPTLLETVPDLCYLVVGDGEYRNDLQELVREKNLENHVVFTGHRSDIPQMLAISDIFVLPTLTEALPTVLIEAMASRKSIVVSNVGGVPELITDGVNGLLVAPSDPPGLAEACKWLIQNKEKKEALAAVGLETAKERFDIQIQINNLSNLYDDIMQNG